MYIDQVYQLEHFAVFNSDTCSTLVPPLRLAYQPLTLFLSQLGLGSAVAELCPSFSRFYCVSFKSFSFLSFLMVQAEHTIVYCQKITCI
jgi:hypothetical protein